MNLRKILCPVDFSDFSIVANEYASLLAQSCSAELIYLQVSLPDVTLNSYAYVDLPSLEKEARKELQSIAPSVPGVNASYEVAFGSPATKIVEYAVEHGVDLIVMGTHGRTGWQWEVLPKTSFDGPVARSSRSRPKRRSPNLTQNRLTQ